MRHFILATNKLRHIMEEEMKEEKIIPDQPAVQLKKAYNKPTLSKIQLVAEEAVLALCKTGTGNWQQCFPDRTCVSIMRS